MPIFEVALPPPESAGHSSLDLAAFVDLLDPRLHLIPLDAPREGTLTAKCILPASEMEQGVLKRCFKISSWSLAEFYR